MADIQKFVEPSSGFFEEQDLLQVLAVAQRKIHILYRWYRGLGDGCDARLW